jgi:hypothetical protein
MDFDSKSEYNSQEESLGDEQDKIGAQDFAPLTANDILIAGLKLLFTHKRINRVDGEVLHSSTNTQRFKVHYGINQFVVAELWKDLHATNNMPEDHHNDGVTLNIIHLNYKFCTIKDSLAFCRAFFFSHCSRCYQGPVLCFCQSL